MLPVPSLPSPKGSWERGGLWLEQAVGGKVPLGPHFSVDEVQGAEPGEPACDCTFWNSLAHRCWQPWPGPSTTFSLEERHALDFLVYTLCYCHTSPPGSERGWVVWALQ